MRAAYKVWLKFVGLQPTVIASRAPHLLIEQSVRFKESWTCIARQAQIKIVIAWGPQALLLNVERSRAARQIATKLVSPNLYAAYPTCCPLVRCRAARLLSTFPSDRKAWGPLVAVIPDPRAARSLRFSPRSYRFARTVDGYHPSRGPQATRLLLSHIEDAARDGPCAHG